MSEDSPVTLVDTDVYSALFVSVSGARRRGLMVDSWKSRLAGHRIVISFQTRAEILVGARVGGWGESRVTPLLEELDSTPTIGLDETVLQSYVSLTAECRAKGHALHAKQHTGDRWIASCAIAKSLPLLSGDGIYQGAPRLELLA